MVPMSAQEVTRTSAKPDDDRRLAGRLERSRKLVGRRRFSRQHELDAAEVTGAPDDAGAAATTPASAPSTMADVAVGLESPVPSVRDLSPQCGPTDLVQPDRRSRSCIFDRPRSPRSLRRGSRISAPACSTVRRTCAVSKNLARTASPVQVSPPTWSRLDDGEVQSAEVRRGRAAASGHLR